MKYTALFQVRLTPTNPSPPWLHAFNFEADESLPGAASLLKTAYKKGEAKMKTTFRQYKSFERLSISQDMTHKITVNGSTLGEILGTPETETL